MKPICTIILSVFIALPSCDRATLVEPEAVESNLEISTGTAEQPVSLPLTVIMKLEGSLGPRQSSSDEIGSISGSVYNGSEWVISSIDIEFTKVASDETRQFRLRIVEKRRPKEWKAGDPFYIYSDVILNPFSSGDVYVASGRFTDDLKKGDFSWGIVSAKGYKP